MIASSALTRRRALAQFWSGRVSRCLSSSLPAGEQEEEHHPQPFVMTRIRPGEWDPETHTNPLYRPKFRSQAKIWSADDFAKQPTVGFSAEFESFEDAGVTLSWLTQQDQKQIYQLYLDIMEASAEKRTSHEYVVRVIAQKFRLTPERVAGVIQLQHNEEQLIRQKQAGEPNINLCEEAADYMDKAIQQEIRDAYEAFSLKKPDEFVEDPIMDLGQDRKTWQVVDDVFDVEQLLKDATVREGREARLAIDGYVYEEDVDDETVELPLSKDCKEMLKNQAKFQKKFEAEIENLEEPAPRDGERRNRWKYVAQVVNTRQLYRQKHHDGIRTNGPMSYTNNSPENTLVEENGKLRRATKSDVKKTSWKPVRHTCEHTYQWAKKGWLDRKVRGDTTAWGKAPNVPPPVTTTPPEEDLKEQASRSDSPPDEEVENVDEETSEVVEEDAEESTETTKDDDKTD